MTIGLHGPMHRRWGIEPLPFDIGDQPVPLPRTQTDRARFRRRSNEVATMPSPIIQPHAGIIPDQELQARFPPIATT